MQFVTAPGRPRTASRARSTFLPPLVRTTPLALSLRNTPLLECAQRPQLSLPSKHSTAGVHATPPTLSLRNTLPPGCAQRPWLFPSKTLPRQHARSRATPPTSLRPEHSVANVGARGGGGWGTQSEVVDSSINLNGHRRRNGRTDNDRRTERSEANVGGNRGVLKAAIS